MNRVRRVLILGVIVSLLAALAVVPVIAQDECCTGGIIIEANSGGQDVATMNPIIASDTASSRVTGFLYMDFVGVDPSQALIAPDQPGAVVRDWDVSEDGLTYTFHMRDDLTWSDGTPITSADVMYTWGALQAGTEGIVDAFQSSIVIDPTGASGILDVQAPDDYTVVVTYATAECTALAQADALAPVPSHIYPAYDVFNDWEGNMSPPVTNGVFQFGEFRPGELTRLDGSPTYADAENGVVAPQAWIYKNVPDQNVSVEQFIAGETNVIDSPTLARRQDVRDSGAQVFSYPGNQWTYLGFNLADPSNPQNAFDENGNPIDQGHHPIFGDVRVRQAIARGIDVSAIIEAAVLSEGSAMNGFLTPSSWAYDDTLDPIGYDPETAAQMLTDAGWVDDDGDPATPRVAQGALYAPDGTPLTFTVYTNADNPARVAAGTIIQDELAQIGVQVDFQGIDFNTLLDIMFSQTYDAIILGWRLGYPDDPDQTQLFTPQSDLVGNGSNFTSYNNPEFNELNAQAKVVPGCDPADRTPLYAEMLRIWQADAPYVPLYTQNGMYAAQTSVEGFDPYPAQLYWNVDTWSVVAQ
jgi:peptide/nickel transport system substrate-binding protein